MKLSPDMMDMEILELDSFEVPRPMSKEQQEKYRRRFLTLFVPAGAESGRGGSGLVYKVRNAEGEVFAMKRIAELDRVGMTEDRYRRLVAAQTTAFRKEFENQQRLSGLKGFPKLYGYGMAQGEPLIVMEWVEGQTVSKVKELRSADTRDRRVPPLVVAQLGAAIFDLISRFEYLDDSFAHRDISSNNIMLRSDKRSFEEQVATGDFDLCLIDFGSATLVGNYSDPSFTVETSVLRKATPEYAPPEMLSNDLPELETLRQSSLIDVYAIGSVLYELLSGETPYRLGKLQQDPKSYYRYKVEHKIPLPRSLHADMRSISDIRSQPRLASVLDQALNQGNFDQARFLEAIELADEQLSHIIMKSLCVEQRRRSQSWEMKDMLERFAENYAANIMNCYNGQPLIPFIDVDAIPQRPTRVVPLGVASAPGSVTVLRPADSSVGFANGTAPQVNYGGVQPSQAGAVASASSAGTAAAKTKGKNFELLPAAVAGAAVALVAVLVACLIHGQPGTLNLFGSSFSGPAPWFACLISCLLPVLVSLPFYMRGNNAGSRLLLGTVALAVTGLIVWLPMHLCNWVVPAVEPMWSLALVFIVVFASVGARMMIPVEEG